MRNARAAGALPDRTRGATLREEVLAIGVESHERSDYADPDYLRMYRAIGEVASAVERLRRLLPPPGQPIDDERSSMVSEAERDLLTAWVRYLYAYDAVYVR